MKDTRVLRFFVLLFLSLTWGSSFILMKKALFDAAGNPVFNPTQVASLRIVLAATCLLPVSVSVIHKVRKRDFPWIAIVGILGSGIPAFLFTNAQKFLDSSIAGILNALTPVFTLLVALVIFRKTFSLPQVIGVLTGLAGAASLIALRGFGNTENWLYSGLVVLATLSYGLSVNTVQFKLAHVRAIWISALGLLMAAIPASVVFFTSGAVDVIRTHPSGLLSMGYVAILAVAGTAVATVLYFWLAQKTTALFASSVTYLMPAVAVLWGLGDGEPLTLLHFLCMILILTGVYLVNWRKKAATA